MKKCIYKENAITLIALVITIIILLILAGITISMSLGENGIITQANNAKKSTQESQEKENFSLEISEYMMESTSLDDLYNKLIDNTSYKKVKK